jgi:hypothetical protein
MEFSSLVAILQNFQIYPEKPPKPNGKGIAWWDSHRLKAGLRGVP